MIHLDKIPGELKSKDRWINWKYEVKKDSKTGEDKETKIPKNPKTGGNASVTDPSAWGSFNLALQESGKFDGIGFVLTAEDDICGVDLDHCINNQNEIEPWAREIVDKLNSYTEITVSGKGLRIWLHGNKTTKGKRKGKIEIYDTDRYFTVTGYHLKNTPATIENRHNELDELRKEVFKEKEEAPKPIQNTPTIFSDEDIIIKAKQSNNGLKFSKLYSGKWEGGEYPSQSEADLALCSVLAFWTQNEEQLDRIFRKSLMYRDKWDEKRGQFTYGEGVIKKALSGLKEVYKPKKETNLSEEIRNYIDATDGIFSLQEVYRELNILYGNQDTVRTVIKNLKKSNIIKSTGNHNGVYIKVSFDIDRPQEIDINAKTPEFFNIHLPLELDNLVRLFPGNLIVVAGVKETGKTSLCLNIAKLNSYIYPGKIQYYNSEMGENELISRLKAFPGSYSDWDNIRFFTRPKSFPGVVDDSGNIFILDFIEIHEDFAKIGIIMDEIHQRLNGQGLAIVAIQKAPGNLYGRGGAFSSEKARLYLTMDYTDDEAGRYHILKIVHAKAWANLMVNPRGMIRMFKIFKGSEFVTEGGWIDPEKEKSNKKKK